MEATRAGLQAPCQGRLAAAGTAPHQQNALAGRPTPLDASLSRSFRGRQLRLSSSPENGSLQGRRAAAFRVSAEKRMFDDPFNFGEDPDMEYGDLLGSGRQDAVDPRPPTDPQSTRGWLNFPQMHNPEIASLALYARGDVRSAAILVAGGVYENLLLFPIIQLLKERHPGVRIDVAASARGKQTYEINKNVRRAWVYDVEDPYILPGAYTEFLGKLKNECYDLVISTRPGGMGQAAYLFLTDARQKIAYVLPSAYGAGAGVFLSTALQAKSANLADGGYFLYSALADHLLNPVRGGPPLTFPPLAVNIPRLVRSVTREKLEAAGVQPGQYTLVHGIESTSAASMRSKGDPTSGLPLSVLQSISQDIRGHLLVVIPNDKDRAAVEAALPSAKIVKITTPGQLAAAIADATAVITSNTAAFPLTTALKVPSVALFSSPEKAELFAPPNAKESKAAVVSSKTGQLADVDLKSLSMALSTLPSAAVPTTA